MAAQPPVAPAPAEQAQGPAQSLAEILDSTEDAEDGATAIESDQSDDEQEGDAPPVEGYCIECEGMFGTFLDRFGAL